MKPESIKASDDQGEAASIHAARVCAGRGGRPVDAATARRIQQALLTVCGESGYRAATVRAVIERSGGHRAQFYAHFANKAECYEAAYAAETEALVSAILGAGPAEDDWGEGLRAALERLGRFASEREALARGILVEVQVARGPALSKRREVVERFCDAIDSARREIRSRHSPPPLTARFMVSAIESAVVGALLRGEPHSFMASIPDLCFLVQSAYFDQDGEWPGEAPVRRFRPT